MSNAQFTVSFGGHLLAADRVTLAAAPIFDYERQVWGVGHDHAHYVDEDCGGEMLLCRVSAAECPEFLAEWGERDALVAADELAGALVG